MVALGALCVSGPIVRVNGAFETIRCGTALHVDGVSKALWIVVATSGCIESPLAGQTLSGLTGTTSWVPSTPWSWMGENAPSAPSYLCNNLSSHEGRGNARERGALAVRTGVRKVSS